MRAGLIAGALLALAVSEPALGQAEVPCTTIGGGKFECEWYRAGNGFTGGSIVAVGTTTVGYLPKGRNWIVCEQKGGDMHSPEGYRNHWFGWTQAENGTWGWASALDASGGDNYGSFGGGTPPCNGAHGTPPAYTGLWGSPPNPQPTPTPQPGAPAVDGDKDGVSPPTDCDDTNSRVYPGAQEVPGDAIDQDCNGADVAGRVSATVAFKARYGAKSSKLTKVAVTEAPAGATVTVTCAGRKKGCPRTTTRTTSAKGSVSLTRLFRKRLRVGARVTIAVTAPNAVGKVRELRVVRSDVRAKTLCLAPGAVTPTKC
jgi:Putative metal-binding motif